MSAAEERLARDSARKGWLLSLPALVLLFVAASGPLLIVVIYSFLTPGQHGNVVWEFSTGGWVGILWSQDIFTQEWVLADAHLAIFWRSLWLSLLTTGFTFLVGFPTAWFIATRPPKERALWLFLITIPFWTNLLIRNYAWLIILREQGWVAQSLNALLPQAGGITLLYNDFAVSVGLVYSFLPFMILPIYSTLEKLDWRLVEAAYDLGANRWLALRRVILPLSMPGVIAGALLVFVPSLGAFITPAILGGGKTLMIGNLIQQQFGTARNWPLGSSLSFLLLAILLVSLVFYALYSRKSARKLNRGAQA